MKEQAKYLSSESVEWYTPKYILDMVVKVLGGIDLDPCANPAKTVPASMHYTEQDDGLNQPWKGRIFMNPPYGATNSKVWCNKFIDERKKLNIIESIVLVGANADTGYFNDYLSNCAVCCLVQRRIQFVSGGENSEAKQNTRPSAIFYFGNYPEIFANVFSNIGNIVELRWGYNDNHGQLAKDGITKLCNDIGINSLIS